MDNGSGNRRLSLLVSDRTDAELNLAMEETLFAAPCTGETRIFVYRNQSAVVTGRFQNPWLEADCDWLAAGSVPVLRRISGGGTVWHDPGNWNFSFLTDRQGFDQMANLSLLARCLEVLGFPVSISPRGDLLLEGRKISGNAMVKKSDRVLHHASLLVTADLGLLRRSLRWKPPAGLVVRSRAVASVPSPVTRLADHCPAARAEGVGEALLRQLEAELGVVRTELTAADFGSIPPETAARYRDWDWNFGQTPDFSLAPAENPSLQLPVRQGLIQAAPGIGETGFLPARFPGFAGLARMGFVGFNVQ